MGAMSIMDRTKGDIKKKWDKGKPEEVEDARATFEYFTKERRYLAYSVDDKGRKGTQMKDFDPTVEEVVLVPPMVGG